MTASSTQSIVIPIPGWVHDLASTAGLEKDEDCMDLAIRLARENVEQGGGPFGAVVVSNGTLVAAGVNLVLQTGYSIAHAEIVALSSAQRIRRTSGGSLPGASTLFTSTEPCSQCFGAVVWSGVSRLVCGATTADAEAIGFDEGPKPDDWIEALERRNVSVMLGVRRAAATSVLEDYARRGGPLYGPGSASPRA